MIPSTLKTIFIDGDLDDPTLILDVQHPYREKDLLLTNQYDDIEDDVHDQVRYRQRFICLFTFYLSFFGFFFSFVSYFHVIVVVFVNKHL